MRKRTPCSDCACTYQLDRYRDDYECDACDEAEDEEAREIERRYGEEVNSNG